MAKKNKAFDYSKYERWIEPSEVTPYQQNAKIHTDKQIRNIVNSIRRFGWQQDTVITADNVLVIGHGRRLAAIELGCKMPYHVIDKTADELTDEDIRELRIADNQTNAETGLDFDILGDEIEGLDFDGFDFDFGIDFDDSKKETIHIDEEDDFSDIDKLEKHYGVPYQGNKSRIADIIISLLPEGKRLVDLFGGGGAMTHCAMLSGKWESFLYNDINKAITGLFLDAINGKYHDERRVITREQFFSEKEEDAYIKYIWSFGNKGDTYIWGADIEDIKLTACHALLDETLTDRRLAYVHFIKMLENAKDPTPNRLAPLERLQALTQLEALQRLEALNIDYRQYEYLDGDVVYCDIPYEQTGKARCDDYEVIFDSKEFYEWAKTRPYQVFFSSYDISDDSFYKVKVKSVMCLIGSNTNSQKRTEYLYSNMPIKEKR